MAGALWPFQTPSPTPKGIPPSFHKYTENSSGLSSGYMAYVKAASVTQKMWVWGEVIASG